MTTGDAIKLCCQWEKMLSALGWHIGLTGLCLYGRKNGGTNDDIDIIIYPHIKDDGSFSKLLPSQVLDALGVTDIEHVEDEYECAGTVDYIYVGRYQGIKVDAFFFK